MKSKNEKEKENKHAESILENRKIIENIVKDIREAKIKLHPHPNRIICFERVLGSIKTKGGLEQSGSFQAGDKSSQVIELVRYFIVAIGDLAGSIKFGGKEAVIGDELIHCLVPSMVRKEIPIVTDFGFLDDKGEIRYFVSFDISEVHSIIRH